MWVYLPSKLGPSMSKCLHPSCGNKLLNPHELRLKDNLGMQRIRANQPQGPALARA